jgi:hypothetical protein
MDADDDTDGYRTDRDGEDSHRHRDDSFLTETDTDSEGRLDTNSDEFDRDRHTFSDRSIHSERGTDTVTNTRRGRGRDEGNPRAEITPHTLHHTLKQPFNR